MKKQTKKAAKAKKPTPTPKATVPVDIPHPPVLRLLRKPKDGELRPGQALTILEILAEAGGELSVPELLKKMQGRIITKNILGYKDVLQMNKPRLLAGKFVEVL